MVDEDLAEWLQAESAKLQIPPGKIITTLLEWARCESIMDDLDIDIFDRAEDSITALAS